MGLWVVTIISSDAISSARRQQRRPTHRWSFSTFLRRTPFLLTWQAEKPSRSVRRSARASRVTPYYLCSRADVAACFLLSSKAVVAPASPRRSRRSSVDQRAAAAMDDLPMTQEPIKVYENTYLMKPSDAQR